MFNKIEFAKLIKQIKDMYSTQEEFSKKSGIGRTYLSQYMNAKLQTPPKPNILEKLADASFGTVPYGELMVVCGYTDQPVNSYIEFSSNETKDAIRFIVNRAYNNNIPSDKLMNDNSCMKCISNFNESDKRTLLRVVNEILTNNKYEKIKLELANCDFDAFGNPVVPIPVLGIVKAGYDYMAQENWDGTVDVEKSLVGSGEEFFALKVKRRQYVTRYYRRRYSYYKETK